MKIKEYIANYPKFKVDSNYQRPADVWSLEDKQCLIDSILKSDPLPLFFLNERDGKYYIVDGQQRLSVIKGFHEQKFRLSEKFSGQELEGKRFEDLPPALQQRFLEYDLDIRYINGDDEKIRSIFSRLQRGKPLVLGERLNALPGNIVLIMRQLAKHPFIEKALGINQNRYGAFPDVIRLLHFEFYGCQESATEELKNFMEEQKDLSCDAKEVKSLRSNLDFLRKCFPEDHYAFLEKHAWILTVYSLASTLKETHVMKNKEVEFRDFVEKFHYHCYNSDYRRSNVDYQIFYDNIRGGWSEKIITTRLDIIRKYAIQELKLVEKDARRQISDEEKLLAYSQHSKCMVCGHKFKDYKEPQYHHRNLHSLGGKTEVSNIMVLCKKCHQDIHRNSSAEFEEVDV